MKKLIVVLVIVLVAGVAWAGEMEELNWQWRALVAELNLKQADANKALQAAQEFVESLATKGYEIGKDGQVVKKEVSKPVEPKPAPKKEEPKKEGGKK